LIAELLLERPRRSWRPSTGPHARKTVASLQFLYYYPSPDFWLQGICDENGEVGA
jgi:hypothetical protein